MPALRLLSLSLSFAIAALSQSAFDIADIHPSPRGEWSKTVAHAMQGGFLIGDRYELHRATMVDLIHAAYAVDADKIYGGPNWLDYDRFEIVAKITPGTRLETLRQMLQTLLADRFHLVVSAETRPMPAWVLTKGKRDLNLKATSDGSVAPGCQQGFRGAISGPPTVQMNCHNATMDVFVRTLRLVVSPAPGNVPVLNSSGIEGAWDFAIAYQAKAGSSTTTADPALVEALVNLGLKLDRGQVLQEVLAVKSVNELPSANPSGLAESLPPLRDPEFEVASLKGQCESTTGPRAPRAETGTRVIMNCVPLLSLIERAWNLPLNEIPAGLPKWLDDGHNASILAKAPAGIVQDLQNNPAAREILNAMLRKLLVDRYKMVVHYEDRPLDAYTLVAVKPKLTKADPSGRTGCVRQSQQQQGRAMIVHLVCQNMTVAQFAEQIPAYDVDFSHPVLDGTGIEGAWDFALTFDSMANLWARFTQGRAAPTVEAADPLGSINLASALERQLGLKLEMHKRPIPVLVIDHMEEKPIEN